MDNSLEEALLLQRWFIIVRIVTGVLIGAGIIFFLQFNIFRFDFRPILFFVLPLYFAVNLFWFAVMRKGILPKFFPHAQLIIDIFIITLGIHFAGVLHSIFVFLYLLPVISAAAVSLRATASAVATAFAVYVAMLFMESAGIIPPADPAHYGFHRDEVEHLAVFLPIILSVAFQSYYYLQNIKEKDGAIARLKDDFLFRVAHDLRKPAVAIRWLTEKYAKAGTVFSPDEIQKDAALICGSSEEMLALLRDLAAIAKGEGAEAHFAKESVNVIDVLHSVIRESESLLVSRAVKMQYAAPPDALFVFGDSRALKEVFANLIDNAVKYNQKGGTIVITHEQQGGVLKTAITDTGYGISQEDLSKLFTPYFRAKTDTAVPGTGMGLYIVKKLLEKMSGRITVNSVIGRGTVVAVYVPLAVS